ncbi:EF-hand domain-containing protein [Polaromonas sp. YR568]|uniref:EF-hand domain-containing protein n=1 Tax=Polaromonas sp. YR568 TaxID=1855301 RepID=UPI00398BF096
MTSFSSTLRALALLSTVALAAAAQAQAPNAARLEKARTELQKRFEAADTNRDGKLTREEAQAKMPRIYKSFDAIDAGHTGAISLADIETFLVSKKGSRQPGG